MQEVAGSNPAGSTTKRVPPRRDSFSCTRDSNGGWVGRGATAPLPCRKSPKPRVSGRRTAPRSIPLGPHAKRTGAICAFSSFCYAESGWDSNREEVGETGVSPWQRRFKGGIPPRRVHGWDTFARQYADLYQNLIDGYKPRRFWPWSELTRTLASQIGIPVEGKANRNG